MNPACLVIKNARVLTFDGGEEEACEADILIKDGVIEAIGSGLAHCAAANAECLDASGLIAIPGLINAHIHSPGNLLRGALDGLPLEIFMLYEVPPLTDQGNEDLTYLRTTLGAIEMLKIGITSVIDDVYFVPRATAPAIDAVMNAYRDSGMRATISLDQQTEVEYEKVPFLRDLLPLEVKRRMDNAPRQSPSELMELYHHLIETWHGAAQGRLGAAMSCSAPQRVSRPYLKWLDETSRTHNLPMICHVLESRTQRVLGDTKWGKSLVRYLSDHGVLSDRLQAIHAIWIDDQDIALLADAGSVVAHNPVCNLRLGSGIMPFRKLRDAGVPICLGTDEACSDDSHNLWISAKIAGMIHSLSDVDYTRWPTATEILEAVWLGGARAIRQPVGRLAPGFKADIALLELTSDSFTPLNDLRRQLVYAETGSSVRHTIVNGAVVVRDGVVTTLDEQAIKAELRRLAPTIRGYIAKIRSEAEALIPYYREMYLKAMRTDVDMMRRLSDADEEFGTG